MMSILKKFVVVAVAIEVLGDVAAVQPRLVVFDLHEALGNGRLAVAETLDLGARQHNARLIGVIDGVIILRAAMAANDLFLTVFSAGHAVTPLSLCGHLNRAYARWQVERHPDCEPFTRLRHWRRLTPTKEKSL